MTWRPLTSKWQRGYWNGVFVAGIVAWFGHGDFYLVRTAAIAFVVFLVIQFVLRWRR